MKSVPVIDPIKFAEKFWPKVQFYAEQKQVIYSVVNNERTFVPAGNMLGKDFVSGFLALWFFLTRSPCRIVTTSADYNQLEAVLWGEIRRFIQTSAIPLEYGKGGPLIINHMHLRKMVNEKRCGISYVIARVAKKGEGMLGHHATIESGMEQDDVPRTLFIADEGSAVEDQFYTMAESWAKRMLIIGNPNPCTNFFFRGVKLGDQLQDFQKSGTTPEDQEFHRKVIKIKAEDSPNVRYAIAEIARGLKPSGEIITPGVLTYQEYLSRRKNWDEVRQTIGLDAEFYEGAETLCFPPSWLDASEKFADTLRGRSRQAKAIGIDPGEGGADTSFAAVDELGLIELSSFKTPDTDVVPREAIIFGRKHNVPASRWFFDRGGGGKQHADRLRAKGFAVQTVAFGEPVVPKRARGMKSLKKMEGEDEERYVCVNRRADMYMGLRQRLDPVNPPGFAIPFEYRELRRQMAPIPLLYDGEGRIYLPPKTKKPNSTIKSLTEMIGRSPDDADALVLAVYGMREKFKIKLTVGGMKRKKDVRSNFYERPRRRF